MPIYEYECQKCQAVSGFLVRKKEDESKLSCIKCGSKKMSKVISRVTYHRSESDRLNEFNPRKPQGEEFYKDSRNIGLWAKKRAKELDFELSEPGASLFLEVPGYIPPQTATMAPPPGPTVSSQETQVTIVRSSLLDWVEEQFRLAEKMLK